MTLKPQDIEEIKKRLTNPQFGFQTTTLSSSPAKEQSRSLSFEVLSQRLKGLLTDQQADELERNINESCEQEND